MRTLVISLAIGLLGSAAYAGEACGVPGACDPGCGPTCDKHCGDCKDCPKCGSRLVCKVVRETKEIKKTVWVVKCEPFCPSLPGCGRDCDDCCSDGCCGSCKNCCDPCAVENAKKIVPPKCGIVRCKKTLDKKEVTCKVPSYKCIPVCPCCDPCGKGGGGDPGCCATGAGSEKVEGGNEKAEGATTTMQRLPRAPLPQVIGTSYRK